MGERFNSPTVNLFFGAEDYIKFLEKLDYYLGQTLVEAQSDKDYPVAKLDDITIYFMHYPSFDAVCTVIDICRIKLLENPLIKKLK